MSKEPSMEEILSSIRRVMAREDAESNDATKVSSPANRVANPFANITKSSEENLSTQDMGEKDMGEKEIGDKATVESSPAEKNTAEKNTMEKSAAGKNTVAVEDNDAQQGADDEVLELTEESAEPTMVTINENATTNENMTPNTDAATPSPKLVADDRIAASRQSMTHLAEMVKPAPRPDMVMSNISLDEMVQDAIQPMLKTWLDENLPEIVERMVSREISRIVGR